MQHVTKLYRVEPRGVSFHNPGDYTPAQFQSKAYVGCTLYIAVQDEASGKYTSLNYSRMITDSILAHCKTWDELNSRITDAVLLGYAEAIPGYAPGATHPENPLVTWDVMTSLNTFKVTYADAYRGISDIFPMRWSLKDLKIETHGTAEDKPNLKYCVPLVNGFACFPFWAQDGTLYAINGFKLCWNTGEHVTPEVQLMDFQHLGEITALKISTRTVDEFTARLVIPGKGQYLSLYSDWVLETPYSLNEYTPLVILGGMVVFPDKIRVNGEYTFAVTVHDIAFNKLLAMRAFMELAIDDQAQVSFYTPSLIDYFLSIFTGKDVERSHDCFVLMVKTPRLYVSRMDTDVWRHGITVDTYTDEGLLRHKPTERLLGYHCDTLSDRKELTIQNAREAFLLDNLFAAEQRTVIRPDCYHQSFQNLFPGDCEMIYLLR